MLDWLTLVLTLPSGNATSRMRVWRALKTSGAAVLRDGVYLLPATCAATLAQIAEDVQSSGGTAYVLPTAQPANSNFPALFERSDEYAPLLADANKALADLAPDQANSLLKQARKLRKQFSQVAAIDFFPGEAQQQTHLALQALEEALSRSLSPDEPHSAATQIVRREIKNHQGRIWATRRRPWVDRLACAWLIRRCIDAQAQILWLATPADCPVEALGFDFDGATFTHADGKVSFEVMLYSFGLESAPLKRIAALVHYLDVGGVQPAEAMGVESVLAGLRATFEDDDQLLAAAGQMFDGLLAVFSKENP